MKTLLQCKGKSQELIKIIDQLKGEGAWYPEIEEKLKEALFISEHLTLKIRELYNLDYTLKIKESENAFNKITQQVFKTEVIIKSQNEIIIEFPLICNKQRKDTYLRNSLDIGLSPYFKEPLLLKSRVVVIEYVYSKAKNHYFELDYDNTEIRSILNVLTKYVLFDDAPEYYDLYCCYQKEESIKTRIYILSNNKFKEWLAQRMVKDG